MENTTKAAAQTAGAGTGGVGLGVLVVWLAGRLHLALSAEEGTFIGGLFTGAGAAVGVYGIVGCCRRLLWGRPKT